MGQSISLQLSRCRAGGEVRRELPAHPGVLHLTTQVRPAQAGDETGQRTVPHQRGGGDLMSPVQRLAGELLCGRDFREQPLCGCGHRHVQPRQHPARRALEDLDEVRLLDQFRDDLHGAGTRSDDGDTLAGEVVVVVPARAVNHLARIRVNASDVGQLVIGQWSGGQHHGAGGEAFATGRLHRPGAFGFVEVQTVDFDAELDAPAQVEVVDQLLDVLTDLACGGVGARPAGVLGERK
jgi:hypothetical protein